LTLLAAVTTAAAEASRVAASQEQPVHPPDRPAAQAATLEPSATRQSATSPIAPVSREPLPVTSVRPSSENDTPLQKPARLKSWITFRVFTSQSSNRLGLFSPAPGAMNDLGPPMAIASSGSRGENASLT